MNKKGMYCYDFPRPAVTVDCIILKKKNRKTKLLLVRRKYAPFKDFWAFPGGFVDMNETTEDAARRELKEETGIVVNDLIQVYTFGDVERDPRGRTISVVYYSDLSSKQIEIKAGDDAKDICWFSLDCLPALAFDHNKILDYTIEHFLR